MFDEQKIRELVRQAVSAELDPGHEDPRPGNAGLGDGGVREEGVGVHPPGGSANPAPEASGHPSTSDSIALGADHGGFRLKETLAAFLREQGWRVDDCGTHGTESVDYPDFAHAVARKVASGACRWGVIVDGAGIGSCMTANKVPGVRAALCYDLSSARNSREHNHANVLTLGAGLIGEGLARQIVEIWLATPWGPGRHARRVQRISQVEGRYLCKRVEET